MRVYMNLEPQELKSLSDSNDCDALAETGFRLLDIEDSQASEDAIKYLHLAMQLGNTEACFPLGELYYNKGNDEMALLAFSTGRRSGDENCTFAYAAILLNTGDSESLDVIIGYANNGHSQSVQLLEDYYRAIGNKREAEYWRKKGANIVK